MQRILILGGGVGGTLTANLLARKLRAPDRPRRGRGDRRRRDRRARLPARASCTSRWAASAAENLQRPERSLLDKRVRSSSARSPQHRRGRRAPCILEDGDAARLRLPRPRDRLPDRARGDRALRRPRRTTSTRAEAALGFARRSTRSPAAGSSSASPGCPTSARRHRSRSRSSSRPSCASAACATGATVDFCSPIGRAFTIESVSDMATPILEREGHRAPHVLQRRGHRPRAQGRRRASRARSCPTTCSSSSRRTRASSSSSTPASRRRPAAGSRPTAHTLQVGGRPNVYALGDATDLPLSKAGSTAHFEAPVVAERIVAAIEGRDPAGKHADYQGKVMCFFEIGDGKGTLLQFDYDHPPRRRSRTSSGTSARSSSTRRTGIRCPRAASDATGVPFSDPRPGPFPGPGVSFIDTDSMPN